MPDKTLLSRGNGSHWGCDLTPIFWKTVNTARALETKQERNHTHTLTHTLAHTQKYLARCEIF